MNNEVIEKVRKAVSKTARKAVKLSGDALDYTKIKLKIAELNSRLDEKYAKIGLAVYEGKDDDEIETICDEITSLRDDIDELTLKLAEFKNQKTCPVCNSVCEKEDEFCRKCGSAF